MERITGNEAEACILNKAIGLALDEIDGLNLEYHNSGHLVSVIERVTKIIDAVENASPGLLNENDKNVAVFAAAYHDIVQNYNIVDGRRKRFSGKNEELSAEKALSIAIKTGLFSKNDEDKIREAIMSTVAVFDPKEKTVYQPSLSCQSSIPALAVALADINGGGIDGAEVYKHEGDLLFLEDNPGKNSNYAEWLRAQVDFIKGRKVLFQKELLFFSPDARGAVANLFNRFDESINAAQERFQMLAGKPV